MKILVLRNGKFFRGDVEERVQIDNLEQIALLKTANEKGENEEKYGIVCELDHTIKSVIADVHIRFNCICGKEIKETTSREEFEGDDILDSEIGAVFAGDTIRCDKCRRAYEITDYDTHDDDELGYTSRAKFIKII